MDSTPLEGLNIYRLKQIDLDGKAVYSSIVEAFNTTRMNISIYPNPTSGIVNIDFETNLTCGILSIRGLEGQIIESRSLDNVSLLSLEIPGPPGVYVMEVVTEEGDIFSSKILKY